MSLKTGYSRREFLRLASVASAGAALAACAPASPATPATSGQVGGEPLKLSYWVFWNSYADVVDALQATDEFKEGLGDNEIEIRTGVASDTAFLTAVAAGTPPDIGATGRDLAYMARGAVVPITDFVAASSVIVPDQFLEANWQDGFYQGVQYGVPANESFVNLGLIYNTTMIEEAGLDPDSPPVTWPEYLEWHQALTEFDSAGNLVQFGLDPWGAVGGAMDTVKCIWGWEWFDPETGSFDLDSENLVEAYETAAEFIKVIGVDNLASLRSEVATGGSWGPAFYSGIEAMIINGYWMPGEAANTQPEVSQVMRATWVPVPESRRGAKVQWGAGHVLLFFREANNPAESVWWLAEFLQTKTACDIIFNTLGWLPAYKPYLEQTDPTTYPGLDFFLRTAVETTDWYTLTRCPILSYVEQQHVTIRESVYREQMTGAEAAAQLQAAAEREWVDGGFG